MDWFLQSDVVVQMGSIVLALLLVASLITAILTQTKPESDFGELAQRIKSWWVMVGFFFLSVAIQPDLSLVLFAFLSFMALKEYFTLIYVRMSDHRALFWSYLAVPVQYYFIFIAWRAMVVIFIPVYMFLLIPFRLLLTGQPKGIVDAMAKIQWGLMAFVFCISHVAFLLKMPVTEAIPGGGKALVLYLVFLTELNDVAQYTFGKLFGHLAIAGHRQVAPTISPKKTWLGLLGGILTTTVVAVLLQFVSHFPLPYAIASGVLISVAGFIGDLVMSSVKRDVGVKDASQLIPGHGGVLDRVDSLAYSAPLFFHFVNYFFYNVPW